MGVPFSAMKVMPSASGVAVYRLLTIPPGTRTRTLNRVRPAGLTVIATLSSQGYSVSCTTSTSAPATSSRVTVLPMNRFTWNPRESFANIQVGSIRSVRGMLPTQQGQVCQARPAGHPCRRCLSMSDIR